MIRPYSLEHHHRTPFLVSFAILKFSDFLKARRAHLRWSLLSAEDAWSVVTSVVLLFFPIMTKPFMRLPHTMFRFSGDTATPSRLRLSASTTCFHATSSALFALVVMRAVSAYLPSVSFWIFSVACQLSLSCLTCFAAKPLHPFVTNIQELRFHMVECSRGS
jgi:hypothetical protein